MIKITARQQTDELLNKVEELSGQNLFACYACGTCSAGCPFISAMDIPPEKVVRRIILGQSDLLASQTIWICASCNICTERCPRGIDMARIMEALRQIRLRRNIDYVNVAQIPASVLEEVPPIALVANFRKNTG